MARLTRISNKKLGEILLEGGLIDEDKLNEALDEQKASGELLGEVLVRLGHVTEQDIARTIATQFAMPYIDVSQYDIPEDVLSILPAERLIEYQCLPLDQIGKVLIMAVAGPVSAKVLETFEKASESEVFLYVSCASEIERGLDRHFGGGKEKGES